MGLMRWILLRGFVRYVSARGRRTYRLSVCGRGRRMLLGIRPRWLGRRRVLRALSSLPWRWQLWIRVGRCMCTNWGAGLFAKREVCEAARFGFWFSRLGETLSNNATSLKERPREATNGVHGSL